MVDEMGYLRAVHSATRRVARKEECWDAISVGLMADPTDAEMAVELVFREVGGMVVGMDDSRVDCSAAWTAAWKDR